MRATDEQRRANDLETAAVHDLLRQTKQLRRRVALPTLIGATFFAWLGMTAHAVGYWSVIGVLSDGRYLVSAVTFAIAGTLCAAPILAPGVVVYVTLRASLRKSWREEHGRKGVDKDWLAQSSRRFG